jgi:hypothetical protein
LSPRRSPSAGRRFVLRGGAEHQVAPAPPDDLVAAVAQDAASDPGDVDVSVAIDHTGEVVAHPHDLGGDPAVKAWEAQPVAKVEEVGPLVGDDDEGAWLCDLNSHFVQRLLRVVEVVKAAIAQYGVEAIVLERQVFGRTQNESEVAAGVAALAISELTRGDVDADDRPVLGEPACVDAVAYGDVEQPNVGGLRQAPQDDLARPLLAPVEKPEQSLPDSDLPPPSIVVEVGSDLIVIDRCLINDEDAVAKRETRAASIFFAVKAEVRRA